MQKDHYLLQVETIHMQKVPDLLLLTLHVMQKAIDLSLQDSILMLKVPKLEPQLEMPTPRVN